MKKYKPNYTQLSWENGETEMFLAPYDGGLEVLDYEYDSGRIHEKCGGKCYYVSRSGLSGAGYIERLDDLTRVGYYHVETGHEFKYPVRLTNEVSIMLPYRAHDSRKQETLKNNPVIMVGDNTIIYCDFFTNMNDVLSTILSGEQLKQEPRILKRTFVNTKSYWKNEEAVEIKFYDLFGRSYSPWNFATELLKDYIVCNHLNERVHSILRISTCEDGTLVRTVRIGQNLYATEVLKSDPCEKLTEPISSCFGWELAETNMLYKVRENDVYIVGWELAETAYEKKVERIARFIPASEAAEFKSFVKEHLPSTKYVEFELTLPKLLFFLNKEKQFANVRKGIATKVREDTFAAAKQFVENFNDKQILEAIPDDLVIKLDDSYAAGNCKPGTQAFVDKYFPGNTETTAGKLKKYADNWNVMRIFRYIATRDMIAGKG